MVWRFPNKHIPCSKSVSRFFFGWSWALLQTTEFKENTPFTFYTWIRRKNKLNKKNTQNSETMHHKENRFLVAVPENKMRYAVIRRWPDLQLIESSSRKSWQKVERKKNCSWKKKLNYENGEFFFFMFTLK